ncbi:MAG: C40 family peptidase [Oscillospiraceae bacterium]|jgi:cell wall-associated NlpC family hydrolase|nr:C40 family peptidase [Oscillospiraceae bacterium]
MPKVLKVSTALVLALALLISAALAEYAAIGKTTDNLRLRKDPLLTGTIITTASKGASVTVTQQDLIVNDDGSWYAVLYNGQAGYMSADYLTIQDGGVSETGYVNESSVNFRAEPTTDSDKIRTLKVNTKVEITGIQDGWYAVKYEEQSGYIRSDLVTIYTDGQSPVSTAAKQTSATSSAVHANALSNLDSAGVSDTRRDIVAKSLNYLGKPYKYGAAGPGAFDCSGFTSYIYKQFGYKINRSSLDQYRHTGTTISKSDLLPGDLVFFRTTSRNTVSHAGIYIGNGQFVHASSGKSRSVVISSINTGYYKDRYVGAKRVL